MSGEGARGGHASDTEYDVYHENELLSTGMSVDVEELLQDDSSYGSPVPLSLLHDTECNGGGLEQGGAIPAPRVPAEDEMLPIDLPLLINHDDFQLANVGLSRSLEDPAFLHPYHQGLEQGTQPPWAPAEWIPGEALWLVQYLQEFFVDPGEKVPDGGELWQHIRTRLEESAPPSCKGSIEAQLSFFNARVRFGRPFAGPVPWNEPQRAPYVRVEPGYQNQESRKGRQYKPKGNSVDKTGSNAAKRPRHDGNTS